LEKNIYTFSGVKIILILLLAFSLCFDNKSQAQSIFGYDYGTGTGSVSSGSGVSPAFFGTPPAGTFFYGFSGGASATLTAANPGLLRIGTNTEAQISAGNGASQFSKFGVMGYAPANSNTSYNKFDVVLAGNTGSNFSDNGVWYFFAGDGGKSSNFIYNNTIAKNLLETCTALRWTFTTGGGISFAYYSYLNSTTGQWINIPGTYEQTIKYTIETISNKGTSSITYNRYGTTYTCGSNKIDIWVDGVLVVQQGNIASISNQLTKVDSYCFYGEGSNTAHLYTDDAIYSHNINANAYTAYYSKSTGNLNLTSSWGTNPDGSGTAPANFTGNQCTYFVRNNAAPTIGANWTVSGLGSKIIVGDGTNACNFTIPAAYTYTGVVDVQNNGTLTLQNAALPTFGLLFDGSTVNYSVSGAQNIAYPLFYNLKISGTGTKTLTANVTAHGTVTVGDGSNAGTLVIPSAYSLTGTTNVNTNSTLSIQNSVNPTLGTLGTGSTVEYALASNGQSVLAANYYNLIFSNYNKTLPNTGTVAISGTFSAGTATGHIVTGSTVSFIGTSEQTVPAFAFNNLTINNAAGVNAVSDFSVNGILNLQSANPSSTKGCITMGTDTLTMGASAATTGIGDVTGKVKRTVINAETSYSFGNQFTTISLTQGTMPAYINVIITLGNDPLRTSAINRRYEIIVPTTANSDVSKISANFHYLDGELNGNTESKLVTGDYDIKGPCGGGSSTPDEHGRSAYDITTPNCKYVGLSNVPLSYFIFVTCSHDWRTIFSLADYTATNFRTWLGANSSNWNDPGNWVEDAIPDESCRITIPDASTTNFDPVLQETVDIQALSLEQGALFTLDYDIKVNGGGVVGAGTWNDVSGGLSPNGKTVTFTGLGATISGNTVFHNIEIGNGASLTNQLGCTMKISGTVIKTGTGKWYTDIYDNTVEYNGTAQTIILTDGLESYYNLLLSGSGIKTLPPSALILKNNFSMSGTAAATALASIVVPGNFSIGSGNTFITGSYNHSVGGNFINNGGTFNAAGSTITMNGTAIQTIGGTASGVFNNLTIINPAGVTLSGGTTTVSGILNLTAGTFNINNSTLNIDSSVSVGSGTFASSSTGTINYNQLSNGQSIAAGNYANLGFNSSGKIFPASGTVGISGTFSPGSTKGHTITSSTIDFNGTGPQTIPAFRYYNLTVSNSGANITLASSGTVYVAGTFAPSSASFGNVVGSTVEFNGTTAQTQCGFTFDNLTLNNTGGLTLTGDCTINGSLLLNGGILYTSDKVLYFGTSATISAEDNTKYINGITFMFPRTVGTGTINFLNCNIQGSADIGDVSISRRTGTAGIVTVGSNLSIASRWNITTSVTLSGTRNVTYTWPSVLDNGLAFSSSNKARLWCYNEQTFLWDTVGIGVDVSVSNPRSMTIPHSHFSLYAISSDNSPLPVTLSSFTSGVNVRDVKLNWVTASETNNAGFEIYRSSQNDKENWTKIGYVNGNGTKNNPTHYSFDDRKLNTGRYKYRLKQIDNNGNYQYYVLSNTIEVGVPAEFSLSQNYPNPFNPITKIDFDLPFDSRVSLVVYDMLGREVKVVMNSELKQAGYYTMELNSNILSSGTYFYRMVAKANGKDNIFTKKMILVK